jgi:hypothetical protein
VVAGGRKNSLSPARSIQRKRERRLGRFRTARYRSYTKHQDPPDDFPAVCVPDASNRAGDEDATAADHARR